MTTHFGTVTEEEIHQMNKEATPAITKSTSFVNTETITLPLLPSSSVSVLNNNNNNNSFSAPYITFRK